MLDITSCSEYAQKMYKSKKGYRDDSLFGEGYHDPKEVLIHEIMELGNLGALEFINRHYKDKLNAQLRGVVMSLITEKDGWEATKLFDSEEQCQQVLEKIIDAVIEDRNYCVWLCSAPVDVVDAYIEPMIESGSDDYEEYKGNMEIQEYPIPNDAIILDDVELDGVLWCWKK